MMTENHVIGIRRIWLTEPQAEGLKTYLGKVNEGAIRGCVESDDQVTQVIEAFNSLQIQLRIAMASHKLRENQQSERARSGRGRMKDI